MRLWPTVSISCLTLFLLISATQAPPQPVVPGLGETIEVSIVNLDVVVTNKKGDRVQGLSQDDFTILEDGKPQAITNFSEYGAEGRAGLEGERPSAHPAADGRVEARPASAKRTIVLFVDYFKLPPFRTEPLFASMKKMLHEVVRPGDAVTIIRWRGEPITVLDYTDDVAKLDETLAGIEKESSGPAFNTIGRMRQEIAEIQSFHSRSLIAAGIGAKEASLDTEGTPLGVRADAVWAKVELQKKTAALKSLLLGLTGAEGKKALFMVSHRFSIVAGLEFLTMSGAYPLDPKLRSEFDMERVVLSVADAANAAGVTMYPIYPEGLGEETFPDASASMVDTLAQPSATPSAGYDHWVLNNETPALQTLADKTGGMTAYGPDIIKLLPRVEDDFTTYYSLAYHAETRRQDRTHKLVVKAKDPSYTVRARREFVEKSDQTKMKERVVSSLFGVHPQSKIPITTTLGQATKLARHRYRIPLKVTVPVSSLSTVNQPNGDFAGSFSVYVAWGGVLGEISDITQHQQPFVIPVADAEKAAESSFTYDFDLLADESTERIAVAVQDDVGRDAGYFFVTLPPRNQMITEVK
ncbi:MAG TPA: VWA domain-containing protein [Thermoanaerobaculia bacterium]|jgi:VWFA-related protein|nr:VWA domain-containing protein [Thermoanaerobaculia bacterium]